MARFILLSNTLQQHRECSNSARDMCKAGTEWQTEAVDALKQLISGPKWKTPMQSGDMHALKRDK